MAWCRLGDKPLSDLMIVSLPTHICVTRPQWVNTEMVQEVDFLPQARKRPVDPTNTIFFFLADLVIQVVRAFEAMVLHDDVIKWKHFPRYWTFVRGIHRSQVNSPHKGQWRGALMLTLICARINGWVNNREAGDLRRHRVHYDVIVMDLSIPKYSGFSTKRVYFGLYTDAYCWSSKTHAMLFFKFDLSSRIWLAHWVK